MIKELIDIIGMSDIEDYLRKDIKLGKSICIRITEKGIDFENDVLINKDDNSKENMELRQWFKEREFYSRYLENNKAVVMSGYTRCLVTSCVKESIFFNYETFLKLLDKYNKSEEEMLEVVIDEFLDSLQSADYKKYYKNNLISIIENIKLAKCEFGEKFKIKIFLNISLENYIKSNNLYLKSKLFNKGSVVKSINKGVSTSFLCVSSKKPLLRNIANPISEISSLKSFDEAKKEYLLLSYLKENYNNLNKNNNIKIKFNPKDGVVEDFKIKITNKLDELKNNPIKYLNYFKEEVKLIDNKLLVYNLINKIMDNSIGINDPKSLKGNLKIFRNKYKEIIEEFVWDNEDRRFKILLEKIISDMYKINKDNSEKLKQIINFDINLKKYYKGERFMIDKNYIFNNIIKRWDKEVELDNNIREFLIGNIAQYLISKSNGGELGKKRMLNKYLLCKDYNKAIYLIKNDLSKLEVGIRVQKIFANICNYDNNKNIANSRCYLIGLLGENLFYKNINEGEK